MRENIVLFIVSSAYLPAALLLKSLQTLANAEYVSLRNHNVFVRKTKPRRRGKLLTSAALEAFLP
jgi:hypothetical protein